MPRQRSRTATAPADTRPDRPVSSITRRGLLALGGAGLALVPAGCAAIFHAGDAPGPAYPTRGAHGIAILVFELAALDFPFHTAAIISAPGGRVLYDPGGWWADGLGQRVGDVTHGLSPAREEAYLQRDYFGGAPGAWRLHRFDRDLTATEAAQAVELAQAMQPVVFGMCAVALTSVLTGMAAFRDLPLTWSPARLLRALQSRPDLRVQVRSVPDTPGAASRWARREA